MAEGHVTLQSGQNLRGFTLPHIPGNKGQRTRKMKGEKHMTHRWDLEKVHGTSSKHVDSVVQLIKQ